MRIVAMDPGIRSIGVFAAQCSSDGAVTAIDACANVDAMVLAATGAARPSGSLHSHIDSFLRGPHGALLTAADVIVLERQPPGSAGFPLELLVRERFGAKCVFVAPQTLHKRFLSLIHI